MRRLQLRVPSSSNASRGKQLKVVPKDPQPDSNTTIFYQGDTFDVSRPRLGYPALLFTEMDTKDAFQKLIDDKVFLTPERLETGPIKEQREVSYFDPDVDRILIVVELRTLLLDNLASLNQRESFIPLYTTFRDFPNNPEDIFALQLEYRNANVIQFGNKIDLGDLNLSQADIDGGDSIVLPTSRDVRITLYPAASDKADSPEYFGFATTKFADLFVRIGEPVQFFVRQDAQAEQNFFRHDLGIQPTAGDLPAARPSAGQQPGKRCGLCRGRQGIESSTLMQRLATQLGVDFKGLSLIGKPGERTQFGCSSRIRNTVAPDNSSLTFATQSDLLNHWLCVTSFTIERDWTWDGLSESGITIKRHKQFTGEAATVVDETVGYVQLKKTASRVATNNPDRSHTRIVFIDAVEPKKDTTLASNSCSSFPEHHRCVVHTGAQLHRRCGSAIVHRRNREPGCAIAGNQHSLAGIGGEGRGYRAFALPAQRHIFGDRRPRSAISGWNFPSRSKIPTTPVSHAS